MTNDRKKKGDIKYALVTGGLGFIGSYIARKLLRDNLVDKVVLLDHYGGYVSPVGPEYIDYRKLRIKGIEHQIIIERGLANYANVLNRLLLTYRPKYIFHLAALPLASISNLNAEEAIEGNILSTSYLLEICGMLKKSHDYEVERFVYTSSSMVYGDFQYTPADENHPTNPKGIYGTMKLAGEIVTRGLSTYYGIKSAIIRPSAAYGPTDMNRRVSQIFVENAFAGKKITIRGEDEALDFTYIEDVAQGFVLAAIKQEAIGQTFNITSGQAHTLLEYVLKLKNFFPNLNYEIVERDAFRPKRGTLSIQKARELLGFSPDYTLEMGIRKYVEFIREYHSDIAC